jgi:hypothetical protein
MSFFTRESHRSNMQETLNREQGTKQAVEEFPDDAPESQTPEGNKPLFKKPGDKMKVFHVDLLGGWLKP